MLMWRDQTDRILAESRHRLPFELAGVYRIKLVDPWVHKWVSIGVQAHSSHSLPSPPSSSHILYLVAHQITRANTLGRHIE